MTDRIRRAALRASLLLGAFGRLGASPGMLAAPVASPRPTTLAGHAAQGDRFIVRLKSTSVERGNASARTRWLDDVGRARGLRLGQARRMAIGADVITTDRGLGRSGTQALLQALRRDPRVEFAVSDSRLTIAAADFIPNDAEYGLQWNYTDALAGLRMGQAWNLSTGSGVVVAVLDTGYTNHSDLAANLVPGYDFISDPASANDGGGRDADARDPGDWVAAGECGAGRPAATSSWHGTHTAGIVAAVTNNNQGVAGIAFNAKVQPVRVLGKCGGWASDIGDAIVWAAGGNVPGVPANATPAEVISLSLGGVGACDAAMQSAIDTAVAAGTVVLVAAGNDGKDADGYSPASCSNAIVVGAGDRQGELAPYSNYGVHVTVAAPGGGATINGIESTINTGTTAPVAESYGRRKGTSMATAHAAGVAALIQSLGPFSPRLVEGALAASVREYPVTYPDDFARPRTVGLIGAPEAVGAGLYPFLYIVTQPTIVEGNNGVGGMRFEVHLSQPLAHDVAFSFEGKGGDLAVTYGNGIIPAGETVETIDANTWGDSRMYPVAEPTEYAYFKIQGQVGVSSYQPWAVVRVLDDDGPLLDNGMPMPSPADLEGSRQVFHFYVPAGAAQLKFKLDGAAGEDVNLYVRRNALATLSQYDCASTGAGSAESCTIDAPGPGDWFVVAHARTDHSGYAVTGSYIAATPTVRVSIADTIGFEEYGQGQQSLKFVVSLSEPPASPVQVTAVIEDGTATSADYSLSTREVVLKFDPGQQSQELNLSVNNDT
ncbi:MAG: S8 family serine peptidase, partial [Arenimonas sp.]